MVPGFRVKVMKEQETKTTTTADPYVRNLIVSRVAGRGESLFVVLGSGFMSAVILN
jgi:hypothetical protein